jgi:hypothetical protein
MGQARRRGTFEERAADPKGYPERQSWTAAEMEAFVARLKPEVTKIVDGFRRALFSTTPKKVKKTYPKPTGGKPCKTKKQREQAAKRRRYTW